VNKDGILRFLRVLDAQNIREDGEWVRASCPLSPWRHIKGADENPSFGIRIDDSAESGWYCFTEDIGGRLTRLIHALWWNSGEYPVEAAEVLWEEENFTGKDDLSALKRHPKSFPNRISALPVPESVLNELLSASDCKPVWNYLVYERRIDPATIEAYRLLAYQAVTGEWSVVFPVISAAGSVVDLYVRSITGKVFYRLNAEITGSPIDYKCTHLFFGHHLLRRDKPVWIFEAPLDAMRLHTLGVHNAMATLGPPKKLQMQNLYAPRGVVLAFDADASGDKFKKKCLRYSDASIVYSVDWSLIGKKDGNEVDELDQVRKVLQKREKIYREEG
jgi:hypothetical protein